MKAFFSLLIILSISTSCSSFSEKNNTPEEFSNNIIDCISNSDFNCYSKFLLNIEDAEYLFWNTTTLSEEEKNNVLSNYQLRIEKLIDLNKQQFDKTKINGYKYESCNYKITKDSDEIESIKELEVRIKKGDIEKIIVFNSLVKTERGWVMANILGEVTELDQSYNQLPCEICLLDHKLSITEQALLSAKLNKKSKHYLDSLNLSKKELSNLHDKKLEKFKVEGNYKSVRLAKDTAEAICTRSILFGSHLSKERRNNIMDTLANEILGMHSGFTIGLRKNIAKKKPRINDKGEMYVLGRTNHEEIVIIEDIDKWRTNELNAFDTWMNSIDKLLIELYKKPYNEFDEVEKIVFNYQLHAIMNKNE